MKNSGIAWVGEIPNNWNIGRIGGLYRIRNEKVSDKDFMPLSVTMKGVLPQIDTAAKTNDGDNRKFVKKGDFAINSRSDRRGSCGISKYDGSVSLINTILKPQTEMNPQYYDWLFHSSRFSDEFYKMGYGIVNDLWTTTWDEMKRIRIPVPPFDEQQRIADFLDKECEKIDELKVDIGAQIDTLEQYKRSLITEAVTHGLNSDAPLKESSVWFGEILREWSVVKGKYVFAQRNNRGNNITLQLLSPTQKYGVIPQEMYEELSGMNAVKLNDSTNYALLKTIHKGDYCISLRSFQGGFEFSEYEGVVSPAYQVFYPIVNVDRGYYKYLFKEKGFIEVMNSYTMSLRDGKNIAFDDFGNTFIPVPPIEEQKEIAEYLDSKCAEIEQTIVDKKAQLDTLDEYKKSLIYEYVTGKKEVV